MGGHEVNFKKSYSREFFSSEGKKIFSTFLFFCLLLGIISTGFVFCQKGFCPKKVGSFLENRITGKVVSSPETFNSIKKVEVLSPSDLQDLDGFSDSISVYGDYLAVGNPYDDDKGTNSGSVYIYKKNSLGEWKFHQKIYGSKISSDSFFGNSLSISKNVLVVGAHGENSFGGSSYFFELDSSGQWVEVYRSGIKKDPLDKRATFFGESVSVFEDLVAIGCPSCNVNTGGFSSVRIGKVYIYKKNSSGEWNLDKSINGSRSDSSFGKKVLLTEDSVFSSAISSSGNGVVYSFESPNFNFKEKIFSDSSGKDFGKTLSFYGDSLFISSPSENTGTPSQQDSLVDLDFGVISDFSLAKEMAYKSGRPLLIVTSMYPCSHASNFDLAIGNSPELLEYVKNNRIVLFLALSDSYGSLFTGSVGHLIGGILGKYSVVAGTHTGIFKVEKKPTSILFDGFVPLKSSSGEYALFNYFVSSNRGESINGIKVDPEKDSSGGIAWRASNYISILDSFFPNQYWNSLSRGGEIGGGSVYVYDKSSSGNLVFKQKIVPEGIFSNENFGNSISVFGNYLVVGSSNFGTNKANQGAFYIYKESQNGVWNYMNQIFLPEGKIGDFFAKSIAIENDSIFVGADSFGLESPTAGVSIYNLFYQEFDTTPPELSLSNYSGFLDSPVSLQILANDDKEISGWKISPTTIFAISQTGLITNKTILSAGEHLLDVFVNDTSNNIATGKVKIEIKAPFCGDGICRKEEENCSNCALDCLDCSQGLQLYPSSEIVNYSIEWEDISSGRLVSLEINQSLSFSFLGKNYSLSLVDFNNTNSNLNLYEYKTFIRKFGIETDKNISLDLNGDDLDDIVLLYDSSFEESIYFFINEIIELDSTGEEEEDLIEEGASLFPEESSDYLEGSLGEEEDEDISSEGEGEEISSGEEETSISNSDSPSKKDSQKKSEESFDYLPFIILGILLVLFSGFIFYLWIMKKKEEGKQNEVQNKPSFGRVSRVLPGRIGVRVK